MAGITRGSQASTNGKRGKTQYGDQSPILTVFGEPPQVIRVTAEQHLPLAQALVEKLGRMMVVVDDPPRTILASPSNGVVSPNMTMPAMAPAGTQGQQAPILQADQLPAARNSASAPQGTAGTCGRCGGGGKTNRGVTCPVCNGKGVTR